MNNYYEIIDNQKPAALNPLSESYTFVSYETLNNIFPPMDIDLEISNKDITLREVSYRERLESSLKSKLEQHANIWEELAKL